MQLEIDILYDVKEYNLVIDKHGNYWQLPFIAEDGRRFPIKHLKPIFHKGMYSAVRIKQRLISEKVLNRLKVRNPRKVYYSIKQG